MINMKRLGVLILVIILTVPFVFSQKVVEVPQEEEKPKNFLLAPFEMFKSQWFWGAVVIIVFIVVIIVIMVFIIRYIIKYIKQRNDVFYKVKTERLKLAKIHRRYNSKHWWKIKKNVPIRLVRNDKGRLYVSKPIAYHRGDYVTHEGSFVISMNLVGNNSFLVFPKTDLLIIPNKDNLDITQRNKEGKEVEVILFEDIPRAEKIIQFNEDEVLLFAESISGTGMFYIPVLRSSDNKIIDLSMPIYQNLKKVVLNDFLYTQTSEFGQIAKKSMDLNPYVRSAMKLNDASSSVEIPNDKTQ